MFRYYSQVWGNGCHYDGVKILAAVCMFKKTWLLDKWLLRERSLSYIRIGVSVLTMCLGMVAWIAGSK